MNSLQCCDGLDTQLGSSVGSRTRRRGSSWRVLLQSKGQSNRGRPRSGVWQSQDVVLARAANVGDGLVLDLDASSAIVGNDVALDVGLAVAPIDDDAVKGALLNLVAPD